MVTLRRQELRNSLLFTSGSLKLKSPLKALPSCYGLESPWAVTAECRLDP